MAFCTNCGADVTGRNFCVQCGKMVSSAQPAGAEAAAPQPGPQPAPQAASPPAYAATPPQPAYASAPPPGPMPPKKTNPIIWVVVGIVGFFMLIGLVMMVGVGLFVHKVRQNPALAMAKLLTAANPDVEVVSSDSGNNTVTFRDKHTGETVTMDFDEIKRGKIMLRGRDGKQASIQARADGANGSLEFKTPEGSMKFGAGTAAKMPDWVPAYPGTTPEGTFSMQGSQGEGGTFKFTTQDPPEAVLAFYEQRLKQAGFNITANVKGQAGSSNGGMVSGEDAGSKRTCMVMVGSENGSTSASIIFQAKL